ncbi:MAG: energy transducer TonB [Nitrosomonadales bacterium]|nr:energy transducer TonB [Nitrosomonadales bacterium]
MPAIQTPDDLPMRDRSFVVVLVVLAHALLLWSYTSLSSQSRSAPREMSISMAALPSPPQTAAVEQRPVVKQAVKPTPVQSKPVQKVAAPDIPSDIPSTPSDIATDTPAEAPDVSTPMESASTQSDNASPSLPDREPDYHAAYLNNPPPVYPMVARRMGWQGRVVMYVEVLESGLPGQIKLHQSSGRDVLDNAAMQAVRGWKFVAARQNGQVVSKWFLVPIPFILKEAE